MSEPKSAYKDGKTREEWNAYNVRLHTDRMKRKRLEAERLKQGILARTCRKCRVEKPHSEFEALYGHVTMSYVCRVCKKQVHRTGSVASSYRSSHGYTKAERDAKLKEVKHCEICGSDTNLMVDHCHIAKKMRGVLCNLCNSAIGKFYDNIDLLAAAIEYLKRSGMYRTGASVRVRRERWRRAREMLERKLAA